MNMTFTKPELAVWWQFRWGQLGFNAFDWYLGVTDDREWRLYEFGPFSATVYR